MSQQCTYNASGAYSCSLGRAAGRPLLPPQQQQQQQQREGFAAAAKGVTLYSDCHYKGVAFKAGAGEYLVNSMPMVKIGNDRLSSLLIPRGFQVTLYEHDNFQGASITLLGDLPCLTSIAMSPVASWNDQASSMRIVQLA